MPNGAVPKVDRNNFFTPSSISYQHISSSLRVIQHMRNEAHRFGITHHRGKRSKRTIRTGLEDIPGIGPSTAKKLLTRFGSIQGIREAPVSDVVQEIGEKKAEVVLKALMIV